MLTNIGKLWITGIIGSIFGMGLSVHYYYLGHYGAMTSFITLTVISGLSWIGACLWSIDHSENKLFKPEENQKLLNSNKTRLDLLEKEIKRITAYSDDMYNRLLNK